MAKSRRQKGVVLVMVLWLLVLLGVMAMSYSANVRVESALAGNWTDSARARAAAEAGIYLAIYGMLEQWGESEENWRSDGTVYRLEYGDIQVDVSIQDEEGKLNLNAAPAEFLLSLIGSAAEDGEKAGQLVDAVMDWRDPDHVAEPSGAEDDDYASAELPYGAKDEYFDSIEELSLVYGMEPAIYEKLAPAVTVYSSSGGISPMVAPRQVLLAVPGVTTVEVEEYLKQRDRYAREGGFMPVFPVTNPRYVNKGRGQTFTMSAQAATQQGVTERLSVVVRLSDPLHAGEVPPYDILVWREGH